MNFISQIVSKAVFKFFSSLAQPFLLILLECLSNSWWCLSSSFSDFEDRWRVPLKSLPVLPEIHGSSLMPSSHNCFRLWEFVSPSGVIQGPFQFHSPEPIISELLILSVQLSFSNSSGESFKYPLISSWSLRSHVSKSPQVYSFVFQFFPVFLYLYFVCFQFLRWFLQDFSSFIYHINLFIVLTRPVIRWRPSQVCAIYLFNPLQRE